MNNEPMKDDEIVCPTCDGTGLEECWECGGDGNCSHCGEGACPDCGGIGNVDCMECDGHRYVPKA